VSWWWNTYADTDSYSYSYGYGYSDSDGYDYTDAQTDAYAEVRANTETSSYTPAKTVAVFAKAKLSWSAKSGERLFTTAHRYHCIAMRRRVTLFGLAHEARRGKSIRISVDTLVPPQIEGRSTSATWEKCNPGASTLIRFHAYQHYQESSDEKEIRFSIRLL
jgi:hypothetical protein